MTPGKMARTGIRSVGVKRSRQYGYSYFGLLFAVALIGLALTGTSLVVRVQQQRQQERQLLFIGQQYLDAIGSYYQATPGPAKQFPRRMQDLLRDPRSARVTRHLRQPWPDPMTASGSWQLLRTPQGGIAGIRSLSTRHTIKKSGFGRLLLDDLLTGKTSHQGWFFIYRPDMDDKPRAEIFEIETEALGLSSQNEAEDSTSASPQGGPTEPDRSNDNQADAEAETADNVRQAEHFNWASQGGRTAR